MFRLALRNLIHDKVRLAVTLTGIVFAVVLMVIELGLFIGFTTTTSSLIDRSKADLWVTSEHVPYIDLGVPFNQRKLYQVRAVPGVQHVEKYIVHWASWKHPDGRDESVQIVGLDPHRPLAGPWNILEGSLQELQRPDGVIIDELYKDKLGVTHVGEVFEINGHRARIVGFTQGIRTFTTSPYVFTTFKRALDYSLLPADQTMFGLVELKPGADVEQVRQAVRSAVEDVDVFTGAEFSSMTRRYWMFTTGAGIALLLAAALGLLVGFVVVAQTIYATTMDHLREFGTLKAMGAPNRYIYKIIIEQAAMSAVAGYLLGMLVSVLVVLGAQHGGASIRVPWELDVAMFFLTLTMCVSAAVVSINKVTHLDPAMVFNS